MGEPFFKFSTGPLTASTGGWGNLNAGQHFVPLTYDLGRALSCVALGRYDSRLWWYVLEQGWAAALKSKRRGSGWPSPVPVHWSPAEILEQLGIGSTRLSEAKTCLVQSRMMEETSIGMLVNLNPEDWVYPANHAKHRQKRLSASDLRYCLDGQNVRQNYGIAEESLQNSVTPITEFRKELVPELRNSVTPITEFRNSHIEEPARSEDSQKIKEEMEGKKESVLPSHLPQGEEPASPRFTGNGHLPGDHAADPDVLDTIRALIGSQFDACTNNGDLWSKIRHHQHVWPTAWILKALKRACIKNRKPTLPPAWNFVRVILQEWDQLKAPDAGPEDDVDDRLVLIPPPPPEPEFFPHRVPDGWTCPAKPRVLSTGPRLLRTRSSLMIGEALSPLWTQLTTAASKESA